MLVFSAPTKQTEREYVFILFPISLNRESYLYFQNYITEYSKYTYDFKCQSWQKAFVLCSGSPPFLVLKRNKTKII